MATAAHQRVFVGAGAFIDALGVDVAGCTRSLRVQFSTFEGDTAGRAFGALLLDRAAAGVEVQMILDGYSEFISADVYPFAVRGRGALAAGKRHRAELLARLDAAGVLIRRVNPPGRFNRYFPFRDHKKVVIVDDRIAYVGGINISDHNYGWHDFMVRVDGPVVDDVVHDFTSTWAGQTAALTQRRDDRDFVLNQSPGRPTVRDATMDLIAGARERIFMESPYLCGDGVETALLDAATRGVSVVLVTPERPNHLHNRVWIRKLRRRLRHDNIQVLGYPGTGDPGSDDPGSGDPGSRGMTHAKLLIVDDAIAAFGSLNSQEIESLTQKELNVFTRDPDLVAELRALADADVAVSRPVPRPRSAFGWFTYRFLHWFGRTWTNRLLRRAEWRATYC